MQFLSTLNPRQKEAVSHVQGPLLIIAGAGSGKTRVLTYRIAHLVNAANVRPEQILAVTFTNKAAQEMKERVSQISGAISDRIWVSTFHSTCVQILRFDVERLNYKRGFQIYDSSDQQVVIKDCLRELNLDPKKFEPRSLLASISGAKDQLLTPQQYKNQATDFWQKSVARIYECYQRKLHENNAFDFDDLIMKTVELLRNHEDVLERYQNRFQYIMVDEYQDTNHAQYELVNLLAKKHQNLCVVGDDDQSIYAFRGADIRNILDFEQDYPQAKVIRLEQNYRSTQNILDAANHVISNNHQRKGKNLFTENNDGDKLYFFQAADERQEALFVAETIQQQKQKHQSQYSDFTILYRTHAQSRILEEQFIRVGIPYRIVSGLRFYDRKEIKDIMAYLRLIANPDDNYGLRRVINVPKRGIGDTTLGRVESYATSHGHRFFEALAYVNDMNDITAGYKKSLIEFYQLVTNLQAVAKESTVTGLVERILLETGYKAALNQEKTPTAEARLENLNEFMTVTKQFDEEGTNDLILFLEKLALMADVDNYDQDADVVTMMTLHAAKGLEFPVVFLVGMEEGVFPSARSLWEPGQIEEERRLAYVGITRAKERLYLTCARSRMLFGSTSANPVSPFILEIPTELLEILNDGQQEEPAQYERRYGDTRNGFHNASRDKVTAKPEPDINKQAEKAPNTNSFKVGDKVRHVKFGEGMIVAISGSDNDILNIAFDGELRKLAASIAPLEKI